MEASRVRTFYNSPECVHMARRFRRPREDIEEISENVTNRNEKLQLIQQLMDIVDIIDPDERRVPLWLRKLLEAPHPRPFG